MTISKRGSDGRIVATNILERLAQHFGDTDEECWIYPGKDASRGGHKRVRLDDSTRRMVHRVAWEAHNAQPVPDGMYVLHTCDNPACFNPNHLYVGCLSQNQQDRVERNRESFQSFKLTLDDYEAICDSTDSPKDLAERYGVTTTRIHQIKRG